MLATVGRRHRMVARDAASSYVNSEFSPEAQHPVPNASEVQAAQVLGYHGTSREGVSGILHRGFVASTNKYDWLGSGAYFFQDAPRRAAQWAQSMHDEPRVLRAEISLEGCLDLLDVGWFSFLNEAYDHYLARSRRLGLPLPRQTSGAHRLDCAVIDYAADLLAAAGTTIRSVRGAFSEGRSAFPNSALFDLSHVQVAVRDPVVILSIQEVDPNRGLEVQDG